MAYLHGSYENRGVADLSIGSSQTAVLWLMARQVQASFDRRTSDPQNPV